jgi:hypothetical protein
LKNSALEQALAATGVETNNLDCFATDTKHLLSRARQAAGASQEELEGEKSALLSTKKKTEELYHKRLREIEGR